MKVLKLGDRWFQPAEQTTARQDGWMQVQIADAGLLKFVNKQLDEETARELVVSVLRSGKREHLLAGALVEPDVPWSVATAEQNAEYFANLTDPESKAALDEAFVPTLAGFFLGAPPSSPPSPNASAEAGAAPRERRKRGKRSTESAVPAPAASGAESPASS
jgi:hypothetical protein